MTSAPDYDNEHISKKDQQLIGRIRAQIDDKFDGIGILDESPFVMLRWINAFNRNEQVRAAYWSRV